MIRLSNNAYSKCKQVSKHPHPDAELVYCKFVYYKQLRNLLTASIRHAKKAIIESQLRKSGLNSGRKLSGHTLRKCYTDESFDPNKVPKNIETTNVHVLIIVFKRDFTATNKPFERYYYFLYREFQSSNSTNLNG